MQSDAALTSGDSGRAVAVGRKGDASARGEIYENRNAKPAGGVLLSNGRSVPALDSSALPSAKTHTGWTEEFTA